MGTHPYDYLILVAFLLLAVAFLVRERRQAMRAGRRSRVGVFIACFVVGVLVAVGGALLVTG